MAKPNRPDYFDQDEPDDQHGTLADAAEGDKSDADYAPALVPKSAFMGKTYEVGDTVRMRVRAIHDDEVELVCEPKSTDQPESEAGEQEAGEEEPVGEDEDAGVVAPENTDKASAYFD